MSTEDRLADPPEPPEVERRVRLLPMQWVGIPLLLVPVLLAAFGVFGESWDTATASSATISVDVRWPTRFRYKQLNEVHVWVENRTGGVLDTVTVALDTAYASRFSTVTAIPDFDDAYSLSLVALRPGERRLAVIELQAERYGRHEGRLDVVAGDTARLRLHTIVFP